MNDSLKILTPEKFSEEIENIVYDLDVSYMEAVVLYCEQNDLEIETVSSLIKKNASLKNNIQLEAEDLNMVTTKSARLPI